MAHYKFSVDGVQLSEELTRGVVDAMRPSALRNAELYLEMMQNTSAAMKNDAATGASYVAHAQRNLAEGGTMHWSRWDVTDSDSISRSKSGSGFGRREVFPSLAGATSAWLTLTVGMGGIGHRTTVTLMARGVNCIVELEAADDEIADIKATLTQVMASHVDADLLPPPPTFKVFIGHGGDSQWKYLHRRLNDTHGMLAEAFESSERAGYHTLVVVDQMVRSSTVAVVVMTGEDRDADGGLRARENVVHEVGFCQGALGIENTIVLLEEGVSEPSNIAGLTQIRFPRGGLIDVEDRIVSVLEQRRQVFAYRRG